MDITLRHQPVSTVARCTLGQQERILVEAGAVVAHTPSITFEMVAEGSWRRAWRRSIRGNISQPAWAVAGSAGGWMDIVSEGHGDVIHLDVAPAEGWLVNRSAWLASDATVEIDSNWSGVRAALGGDGVRLVQCSGIGGVLLGAHGLAEGMVLDQGETVIVDSSIVLGFANTVRYERRRALGGRSLHELRTGEGFTFQFWGPGVVLISTRQLGRGTEEIEPTR
ncbi:MAG: AIM24 family protein [Acidimicrobiia bacterium]|nr:AIM24 family protein [Acidimicrobiia bacterium]MBP8180729.1 AIM24 family protein [Acidimicrobiia bacterium]